MTGENKELELLTLQKIRAVRSEEIRGERKDRPARAAGGFSASERGVVRYQMVEVRKSA